MTTRRILLAFAAGFIAVLVFHQGGLALMNAAGLTDRAPYNMQPTRPFGVPQILSSSFWGGLWGIVLAWFFRRALPGWRYLLGATLFGAGAPSMVAFFIVAPLKDRPIAADGDWSILAAALFLNGMWGLGTALMLQLFGAQRASPSD